MIDKRIIDEAFYIIEKASTVRETAKVFGVSKSTVHKDVSVRLKRIDIDLHKRVKDVLRNNFREKHIRGGLATKEKCLRIKNSTKSTTL